MANISSIGGNPIVPAAVQPNSVTDAMLKQTGGVLENVVSDYETFGVAANMFSTYETVGNGFYRVGQTTFTDAPTYKTIRQPVIYGQKYRIIGRSNGGSGNIYSRVRFEDASHSLLTETAEGAGSVNFDEVVTVPEGASYMTVSATASGQAGFADIGVTCELKSEKKQQMCSVALANTNVRIGMDGGSRLQGVADVVGIYRAFVPSMVSASSYTVRTFDVIPYETLRVKTTMNGASTAGEYAVVRFENADGTLFGTAVATLAGTNSYDESVTVPWWATRMKVTCDGATKAHADTYIDVTRNSGYALFIGDSYTSAGSLGNDVDKRFSTLVSKRMNLTEINYAVGGMGYVTGATPFITQLENAISDTTYDHSLVKYVFVCGSRNDNGANLSPMLPDSTYVAAVQNVVNTALGEYKNAKVILVPTMIDNSLMSNTGHRVYCNILYAAQEVDCCVIPNAYSWLTGLKDYILSDNVHPNVEGHAIIASHIMDAMTVGDTFAYPNRIQLEPDGTYLRSDARFGLLLNNGMVTANASFVTIDAVPAGTTLFSYETSDTQNIPCYGPLRNVLAYNPGRGEIALLVLRMEYTTDGYRVTVSNQNPILTDAALSVWDQHFDFGMQGYASN